MKFKFLTLDRSHNNDALMWSVDVMAHTSGSVINCDKASVSCLL